MWWCSCRRWTSSPSAASRCCWWSPAHWSAGISSPTWPHPTARTSQCVRGISLPVLVTLFNTFYKARHEHAEKDVMWLCMKTFTLHFNIRNIGSTLFTLETSYNFFTPLQQTEIMCLDSLDSQSWLINSKHWAPTVEQSAYHRHSYSVKHIESVKDIQDIWSLSRPHKALDVICYNRQEPVPVVLPPSPCSWWVCWQPASHRDSYSSGV